MVILWSVEAGSALNEFPWRNYHGGASSLAEPGQVQVKLSTGSKAQSESRTLMVSGPDQPRLISGEMAGPDRWLLTDHLISRQPGFLCPTEPFHRGGVTSAGTRWSLPGLQPILSTIWSSLPPSEDNHQFDWTSDHTPQCHQAARQFYLECKLLSSWHFSRHLTQPDIMTQISPPQTELSLQS